jgi:hypothetical protein
MSPSSSCKLSLPSSREASTTSTPASTPPQEASSPREVDPYAAWKQQMRNAHEARILSTSAMIEANYGKEAALAWELGQGYFRMGPQE